jgi:hypothetical protein
LDLKRRKSIQRVSPNVQNSTALGPDIPPISQTLAKVPHARLSKIGKNGERVGSNLFDSSSFKQALGTDDRDAGFLLLAQAVLAKPRLCVNTNLLENIAAVHAVLRSIGPQDKLEGVLAVQMTAVHNLAMDLLLRASRADESPEVVEANVNRAYKLLRTFTSQMEALNRHRGKISQMVVGNVNIHDGGKAIVGPVNHSGPGKDRASDEKNKTR